MPAECQNNLAELWSLLNFILPDIFDDLDSFQQWFNFDAMSSDKSETDNLLNKTSVVTSLHAILKPFLLRRLKVDVEKDLPPKKEYLLYAPLTQQQKDIYQAIVSGQIRQYLVEKKTGKAEDAESPVPAAVDANGRGKRQRREVNYKIEENDARYIDDLEKGVKRDESVEEVRSAEDLGQEWALKQASKSYYVPY
jgi:ATP-dependent DNA helicase